MPPVHLRSAVEALLFSSDQPLTLALLAEALDPQPEKVSEALAELGADYEARESGVELREMAGGWIVTSERSSSVASVPLESTPRMASISLFVTGCL